MAEYIDKSELYKEIAELEELSRKRVVDTPTNSPAYARYVAQLNERTMLKHKIADTHAADVAPVVRCEYCKYLLLDKMICTHPGNRVFNTGKPTFLNHFCSYGEKKEDRHEFE